MIVNDRLLTAVFALLAAALIVATIAGPIGSALESFSLFADSIDALGAAQ